MKVLAFVQPETLQDLALSCARTLGVELEFCDSALDQMAPEDRASIGLVMLDRTFDFNELPYVLRNRLVVIGERPGLDWVVECMRKILQPT